MPADALISEMPNFEHAKTSATQKLQAYAEELPDHELNIVTETVVGFPWEQIIAYASDKNIELIVMGTHGTSGLNEFLIGSNAEKVVRFAECPVLTVRDKINYPTIKNMVFASTFYGETERAFPRIKNIADRFGAHLYLLKVITPNAFETTRYTKKLMTDFAHAQQLTNYSIHCYNESSVEKGVLNFAEDEKVDLISIETHGRKGLSRLFVGSIAEDITNHAQRPVLTVKIEEAPRSYGVLFPGS